MCDSLTDGEKVEPILSARCVLLIIYMLFLVASVKSYTWKWKTAFSDEDGSVPEDIVSQEVVLYCSEDETLECEAEKTELTERRQMEKFERICQDEDCNSNSVSNIGCRKRDCLLVRDRLE